jgi:hypothetical protein
MNFLFFSFSVFLATSPRGIEGEETVRFWSVTKVPDPETANQGQRRLLQQPGIVRDAGSEKDVCDFARELRFTDPLLPV